VFERLQELPHCVFLDSALAQAPLGRYSFVAADPFATLTSPVLDFQDVATMPGSHPLDRLAAQLAKFQAPTVPHLPPLQGGAIGLLSYDLNRSLERLPAPRFDEFGLPAVAIGLYDVVFAFDHQEQRGWIISQGFPELDPASRQRRAALRMEFFLEHLQHPRRSRPRLAPRVSSLDIGDLAPQHEVGRLPGLTSNFSRRQYLAAVERAIEYIRAGDIFQVNLAQRLLYPSLDNSVDLYLRLRERNPATFAGYFDLGQAQIISASPERFVSVRNRQVETRPIKGTRSRSRHPVADLFAADDLQQSEKDRAENVMIVDLLRNDLSRVCDPRSVKVTQLCGLETYQFVQHLVSVVEGELAADKTPLDVLRQAFPGGSITGAPKIRAMEIVAELEPTARGAYCGSLGYVGFDGTMDWNILIRTITAARGWWQMPVGGGIVAQSEPEREYEETWHKALGLLRALTP
jgi:para-aminobenzoate synthetase component 1